MAGRRIAGAASESSTLRAHWNPPAASDSG